MLERIHLSCIVKDFSCIQREPSQKWRIEHNIMKKHTKYIVVNRLQTCISQKLGMLEIWKLCQNIGTDSSFMYREGFFLYTTRTQSKMTNRVQYHEKTHKIHRSDRIQTCISQKLGMLEIWKLCQNVGKAFIFLV